MSSVEVVDLTKEQEERFAKLLDNLLGELCDHNQLSGNPISWQPIGSENATFKELSKLFLSIFEMDNLKYRREFFKYIFPLFSSFSSNFPFLRWFCIFFKVDVTEILERLFIVELCLKSNVKSLKWLTEYYDNFRTLAFTIKYIGEKEFFYLDMCIQKNDTAVLEFFGKYGIYDLPDVERYTRVSGRNVDQHIVDFFHGFGSFTKPASIRKRSDNLKFKPY